MPKELDPPLREAVAIDDDLVLVAAQKSKYGSSLGSIVNYALYVVDEKRGVAHRLKNEMYCRTEHGEWSISNSGISHEDESKASMLGLMRAYAGKLDEIMRQTVVERLAKLGDLAGDPVGSHKML